MGRGEHIGGYIVFKSLNLERSAQCSNAVRACTVTFVMPHDEAEHLGLHLGHRLFECFVQGLSYP